MIRVNVLYPAGDNVRFDFDYYVQRHMPLVKDRLRPLGMTELWAEKGMGGLAPGVPATYVCVATLEFTSSEALQQGLATHGPEILADIPKFTNAQPVIQVSEVLM
jgi:uncharacterized protein (TIGR02118 family)